jgi:hypothetical protein
MLCFLRLICKAISSPSGDGVAVQILLPRPTINQL